MTDQIRICSGSERNYCRAGTIGRKGNKAMKKQKLLRWVCLGAAIIGGLELLGSILTWVLCRFMPAPGFSAGEAVSVGIIGGADGPTAIFVTASAPGVLSWLVPALLLAGGIRSYLYLRGHREAE